MTHVIFHLYSSLVNVANLLIWLKDKLCLSCWFSEQWWAFWWVQKHHSVWPPALIAISVLQARKRNKLWDANRGLYPGQSQLLTTVQMWCNDKLQLEKETSVSNPPQHHSLPLQMSKAQRFKMCSQNNDSFSQQTREENKNIALKKLHYLIRCLYLFKCFVILDHF